MMKNKIIIFLSILVIALAGFLLHRSLGSEMSEVEIKAQFSDIKIEYKKILSDLEDAIKETKLKNKEIIAQQREIDRLINKAIITEEELNRAKDIMDNLSKVVLDNYKNKLKVSENNYAILLQDKNNLFQELIRSQEKINQLNEKYTKEKSISASKDKVIEKKDKQINIASRLILSNFNISGFKVRNSGKEIQTDKASRIDRIKVSFDIIPNQLIESGKKFIYTIIYKPSGEIVSFENKMVGTFIYQGNRLKYSDELIFDYTNGEEKTLEFVWDNSDFERGNYTIEVYEKSSIGVIMIGKTIKSLR